MSEAPSITLAVFAYRQAEYIEAAVKGALQQTHSPLQILLSDDCSPDSTFSIMQRLAADYKGPHEILLNRNEHNLGLPGHLNRIAELATGDVIVLAAGDDVSLPDRVSILAAEFARTPTTRAVFSGYTIVDASGQTIRDVVLAPDVRFFTSLEAMAKSGGWIGLGATFAYHRDCFLKPLPIPLDLIVEDGLLPFRAALMGKVAYVREPTLRYRKHDSSLTVAARFDSADYEAKHQQFLLSDLEWALRHGLISPETCRRVKSALERWRGYAARERIFRNKSYRLLARLHYVWYFSDVARRRLKARLRAWPRRLRRRRAAT